MKNGTPKILAALTPPEWNDFLPGETGEWLRKHPGLIEFDPTGFTDEAWAAKLHEAQADVLVTAWKTPPLPVALFNNGVRPPEYVCHLAGTIRKLIPRELIEGGLRVTNWGNSISNTVAECALLLTLSALRRSSYWAIAMHREGKWKDAQTETQSLFGRRVGLHGFGAIAQALVPLLRPFGVEIQAYSPNIGDEVLAAHGVARASSLETLFDESQVLIELAAYTPENHHIVDESLLRRLPRDGVFVNVGRGAVVDEEALLKIAREGFLQIALDVYETEPLPPDHPLRGLPNVTLLPHLGGPTRDRRKEAGAWALSNLQAYLNNQPLKSVVTLDVYDRAS